MHSTLRTELRGTQRILNLTRLRPIKHSVSTVRAFSQGCPRRNENKPDTSTPTPKSNSSNNTKPAAAAASRFRSSDLGSEIEKWINHLSKQGRSLDVWDTISEKDDNGDWRLLPQARKDLEDVNRWAKDRSSSTNVPFGIKVADGRIRAVSTQDLQREQTDDFSSGLTHGPFVPAVDTQASQERNQAQMQAGADTAKTTAEIRELSGSGSEGGSLSHVPDLGTASVSETPKLYGSATARRQRAQRAKERTSIYSLPAWFSAQNVSQRGQSESSESAHFRVHRGALSTDSRGGIVLLQTEDVKASPTNLVNESSPKLQEDPAAEQQQSLSTGGDIEPSGQDPALPTNDSGSAKSTQIFVPLPDSNKTYYIEEAQHNELMTSARGRLQPPASGSLDNRPGGIRGHLIIHYAAGDGELFLDHLVEDMAKRLDCNLVTLDVQDISSLIVEADMDSMIKHEASVLGYDVYGEIYKDESMDQDAAQPNPSEEQEDIEEDFGAPTPQGMPFMVGKPITIDLKALFSSKPHRRSSNLRSSSISTDIFGSPNPPKPSPPLFSAMIESILSSPNARKTNEELHSGHGSEQQQPENKQVANARTNRTIIHIKELRSIQDTHIGKQFLMQLYEQVERRRTNGESIMIVGTECSRDSQISYDEARINNLQSSDQEEMLSTLVITPAENRGNHDYSADRSRRLQIINARHLWQMLQSKNITLGTLRPTFWKGRSNNDIHAADKSYLEKGLWSAGYVQRLAAILASSDFATSQHPIAEAAALIELSDNSKLTWAKQGRSDSAGEAKKSGSEQADRIAKIRQKANKHEKRLLGGVIEPKRIATTFKDIHIPDDTVQSLQTLTTLSLVRPDAFKYGVLASDRIPGLLLYGPPGTGKTLAAKAVARESGATMLEVSSADINDMYVGEGEKNVKALFSLARKLSPCVVFLDEADAMFSARSAQGRRVSHRELLNQFLREWDGMSNDSGSAFIMVATNRPMDLDDAVLRRLPRRLLIDLPTEKDRLEILKIHLRHEQVADDVNLSQIATKTPFYSGSDLKNLAVSAALNAVREETANAKKNEDESAVEYPAKRTLTARDFDKALEEIGASISEDMSSLRDIKKFDEQYGDRKGRKRKSPKWGFKTAAEADAVLDTVKVRT